MLRWPAWICVAASVAAAFAAPRKVLYLTHSAGFRHGSITVSRQVLESLASRSGALEVTSTEEVSAISSSNLRDYDVVFFFTSGELALSDRQKQDLMAFVREGKGFGGVHSATDTLYQWPEYGELIGGYFDGHPWTQQVSIDVEDPDHPAMRHLAPSFRISDEIYQFRAFSRDRVRVLMTLDTATVDLRAQGVNRADRDFALAWCRTYGQGRVFYTALGHGDETWIDPRFQTMLLNALLWLAGEVPGDAAPRSGAAAPAPAVNRGGVVNAASFLAAPQNAVAPGSLISIFGAGLTSGSTLHAAAFPLPAKLAGTTVTINGAAIPLLYASPGQINAQLPFDLAPGAAASLVVAVVNRAGAAEPIEVVGAAPGIFAVAGENRRPGETISIYATGLGAVRPPLPAGAAAPLDPLSTTVSETVVVIGGTRAPARFSGLAPLFAGLYQVDAVIPPGLAGGTQVSVEIGGRASNVVSFQVGR